MVTTLTSWFAQARSRKAISSSRPKTSLPVTGSLAIEIFFGPGFEGDLRVRAGEAAGGTLCKVSRVILRPVSIRAVIVGIAFRRSPGF